MSKVISQSKNIPECDRLQLYHRYPGHPDRFQCLCLYFPLVNNSRIQRLGGTFGHPLIQPPLLTGARAACPAHCGSEFFKDEDLTAPLGNLFYTENRFGECWSGISYIWDCSYCFLSCKLVSSEKSLPLSSLDFPPRYLYTFIDPSCTTSS